MKILSADVASRGEGWHQRVFWGANETRSSPQGWCRWVEWWWRECPQQTWICARAFIPCAALCEFFFLLSPSLFLNFGSLPSPASTSIVFLQILDTANLRAISIARSFQFQISPSLPSLSQCLVEFVLDLMSEREHCFVSPRNYILPCRYDC